MVKRLAMLSLLLGLFALPAAMSTRSVSAEAGVASEAAAACQEFAASGLLDEIGITVGECVNNVKGPSSANANNFIAGLCGIDFIQEQVGATNKGQCIKIVSDLFS